MALPLIAGILARLAPVLLRAAPVAARFSPGLARGAISTASRMGASRAAILTARNSVVKVTRAAKAARKASFNALPKRVQNLLRRGKKKAAAARQKTRRAGKRHWSSFGRNARAAVHQFRQGNLGSAAQYAAQSATNAASALHNGPRTWLHTMRDVSSFGMATGGAVRVVKAFAANIAESRRPMAEFNGRIAAAFARLDSQRIGRSMRLGAMTSSSTAGMTKSLSRLENELLPYTAAGVNALNKLVSYAVDTASFITKNAKFIPFFGSVGELLRIWLSNENARNNNVSQGLLEVAMGLSRGDFNKRRKPPADDKGVK